MKIYILPLLLAFCFAGKVSGQNYTFTCYTCALINKTQGCTGCTSNSDTELFTGMIVKKGTLSWKLYAPVEVLAMSSSVKLTDRKGTTVTIPANQTNYTYVDVLVNYLKTCNCVNSGGGSDSQTLSIAGNSLSISNGNTVTLPTGTTYTAGAGIGISGNTITNTGDLSNTNELQTLSISGGNVTLSGGGGTIALPDNSQTNEIQTLSLAGNTLSLSSGGGSVILPNGTTNLSNTPTATNVAIASSTGTGTTIAGASSTTAGVMSAADKSKLDALPPSITAGTGISISGAGVVTNTAPDQIVSITGGGISTVTGTYPNFTVTSTEVDGSTTNETNTAFAVASGNLTITDGAGPLSVPVTQIAPVQSVVSATPDVTVTATANVYTVQVVRGSYTSDATASAAGVPIGGAYEVATGNPYGLPTGTVKIRRV